MSVVPLAHDVTGSGPLIVLIHGITEDRRSWDPLVADLAERATVLRVDLRGHGGSPLAGPSDDYRPMTLAADVRAVVEQVEDPAHPAVIIGHSLGGIVATAYGSAYPAAAVVNIDQPLALGSLQAQVLQMAPQLRSEEFSSAIEAMFAQMYGALDPEQIARLDQIRAPRQEVVLGVWAVLLDLTPAELAAVVEEFSAVPPQVPYVAIEGIPSGPDYLPWLVQRIPQVRFEDWGPVGHYPHLHDPERFLGLVEGMLA